MPLKIPRCLLSVLASTLLIFFVFPVSQALAEEASAHGPLDGMVFVGKIGLKGNPDLDDELHFQNGRFWSLNCVKCGFQPGSYWVRFVGERIQFRGELTGDNATLFYEGEILDGRAEVAITWTKSRWYWKINKALAFSGTVRPTLTADSVDQAISTASAARPELESVCSR